MPGSPVDVKAIATSDDSVVVAWKSPDNPNGVIKSYTVYWKNANDKKVDFANVSQIAESFTMRFFLPKRRNETYCNWFINFLRSLQDTGSHTTPARESNHEVTGLKKGKRYEFWVAAQTMAGEGSPSRIVAQSPSGPTGYSLATFFPKS